jgi:hypothetical protein
LRYIHYKQNLSDLKEFAQNPNRTFVPSVAQNIFLDFRLSGGLQQIWTNINLFLSFKLSLKNIFMFGFHFQVIYVG